VTAENAKDPLMRFPGYLMRRASLAAVADLNERLSAHELRHTDVTLLQLIRANPGIKQSDAGKSLSVKRANMVPLVARLEKRALIARTPIDGRSFGMKLTARGRALAKKSLSVVEEYERELMDRVPAELQQYVAPILIALWIGDSGVSETAMLGGSRA